MKGFTSVSILLIFTILQKISTGKITKFDQSLPTIFEEDFKDDALYDEEQFNEIDSVDQDWLVNNGEKQGKYSPTWESLDSRPLPDWYDNSKVGIFIHWGVFSVPGIGDAWFWQWLKDGRNDTVQFMKKNYKPGTTYQDLASEFTATFFDPESWAELFAKSGAKYVVLTSKHHDGFTLWPSKSSFSWNSVDVGPHLDLVSSLASAIRSKTSLKFGLYHSLFEFQNPLYLQDRENNFTTDLFTSSKTIPELYDLINTYKPEVLWSDGDWEVSETYWKSKDFLAWLYNESPVKETVVTNDRWGKGTPCKHGGFYNCDDRFNPGYLLPHKWENCFTLDKLSWGHRRNAKLEEYLTPEELIKTIVETVACGGNVLVNVGPTRDGMIEVIQQERLLQMGEWLGVNGEAIFNTVPYKVQNDSLAEGVWYTSSKEGRKVYAIMTKYPGNSVTLGSICDGSQLRKVTLLGSEGVLSYTETKEGLQISNIHLLDKTKSKWAWTLVLQY